MTRRVLAASSVRTHFSLTSFFALPCLKKTHSSTRIDPRILVKTHKIKLDLEAQQQLTELVCSDPPDGRAGWTLQLLGDRLVVLGKVASISRETVRKALKKTTFKSES